MRVGSLFESEAAPLASHGGELVTTVQLDVLYGVTEGKLVNSRASRNVAMHFNNWQLVDQFLSIGLMGSH